MGWMRDAPVILRGKHLMAAGVKPGPAFRTVITAWAAAPGKGTSVETGVRLNQSDNVLDYIAAEIRTTIENNDNQQSISSRNRPNARRQR